jgi:hypothetical protein
MEAAEVTARRFDQYRRRDDRSRIPAHVLDGA